MAKSKLQQELEEVTDTLDTVGDLVDEALDPELTREQVVAKLKEIGDQVGVEAGDEQEEQGE